jgi:hypothetical protein
LSYPSYKGKKLQYSGAYVFRPDKAEADPLGPIISRTFVSGPVLQELVTRYAPYVKQTTRLFRSTDDNLGSESFLELDFEIGPIPLDNEIISRFTVLNGKNNGVEIDNNGMGTVKKTYRDFPNNSTAELYPPAANYHPFVYSCAVDIEPNAQLSFVINSSRGISPLKDSGLEIMLHRRTSTDDFRGLFNPLNDTTITKFTVRLSLDKIVKAGSSMARRHRAHRLNYPLEAFAFTALDDTLQKNYASLFVSTAAALNSSLPSEVHLMTLANQVLYGTIVQSVRVFNLESSASTSVDLKQVFTPLQTSDHVEMLLSFDQKVVDPDAKNDGTWTVPLEPLQIRTYMTRMKV